MGRARFAVQHGSGTGVGQRFDGRPSARSEQFAEHGRQGLGGVQHTVFGGRLEVAGVFGVRAQRSYTGIHIYRSP